jgi:TonB family protein
METPHQHAPRLLVELEPRGSAFWSSVRASLHPVRWSSEDEYELWRDVFVRHPVPWGRFFQSAILHSGALAMCWMISAAWLRQQSVLSRPFDRSSVITYSPEEYLPPLNTGLSEDAPKEKGDPEYSRQPIISVPREADNRSQTIVAPPDVRLNRDVPMPNIIAMGGPIPAVPLDATRSSLRIAAQPATVVAPAPELDLERSKAKKNLLTADVIAPPPEIAPSHIRGVAGLEAKIVEPPPADLPRSSQGRAGPINIGPSAVIAPAPELAIAQQHTLSGRGSASLGGGSAEPVAPPPSLGGTGGAHASGRLIALGIHPAAPAGPLAPPGGNRRGTFAATPEGRPGASGTPGGSSGPSGKSNGNGKGSGDSGQLGKAGSLPGGIHVGAMSTAAPLSGGLGSGDGQTGDSALIARASTPRVGASSRAASPIPEDKVSEAERKVFGGKRLYSMTLNMPNLNSATGSWVMRFAELKASGKQGELLAPIAMQKSDPGYPLELMRDNVQGTVTLYAVIHSDGSVKDIRVLDSPDERLDAFASSALSRWKFVPASKNGAPVALEAVVKIPFRIRRSF